MARDYRAGADAIQNAPLVIERVAELYAEGRRKSEARRVMCDEVGWEFAPRQWEPIWTAAKKLVHSTNNTSRLIHRAKAITWFESVIADEANSVRVKLRARELLMEITGTSARMSSDLEDPDDIARLTRQAIEESDAQDEQSDEIS